MKRQEVGYDSKFRKSYHKFRQFVQSCCSSPPDRTDTTETSYGRLDLAMPYDDVLRGGLGLAAEKRTMQVMTWWWVKHEERRH